MSTRTDESPSRMTRETADADADADADVAFFTPGEPRIAVRASRQHGVVARWQLLADGVPSHAIDTRVRSRRLRVVYRGVYEVRGMTTSLGRYMAAVLACGDRAVLCGRNAGVLWGLGDATGVSEVLVEGRHRRVDGVLSRRVRPLLPAETTVLHGIPITTPARTLLDLAGVLTPRQLEQAAATALRSGIVREEELRSLLASRPRHRGAPSLRMLVERGDEPALTRSELEDRLLALIDHVGLPRPRANVRVAGLEVDFAWPDRKLVVETDGRRYHDSERAWHRDRQRDRMLVASGYRVMRVTAKLLKEDPVSAMVQLAVALLGPVGGVGES